MKPIYKLLDWIPNPEDYKYGVIQFSEYWLGLIQNKNPQGAKIVLDYMENDDIIFFYGEEHEYSYFMRSFSTHPDTVDFIKKNVDNTYNMLEERNGDFREGKLHEFINWAYLCEYNENPSLKQFLKERPEFIDWNSLGNNEHPELLSLFFDDLNIIDTTTSNYRSKEKDKTTLWHLSKNPSAIPILKKLESVSYLTIAQNPSLDAFELIEKYRKLIDWSDPYIWNDHMFMWKKEYYEENCVKENLYINNIIKLTEKHYDEMVKYVNWDGISKYYMAFDLLKKNQDKINWDVFCACNSHSKIIEILENNIEKIKWSQLCRNNNKHIIPFLEKHLEKIDWDSLSENKHAIHILKDNERNINWELLSQNKNAIDILKDNPEKIDWNSLRLNRNPKKYELYLKHWNPKFQLERKTWSRIAEDPYAIDFLKYVIVNDIENDIEWSEFFSNRAIFELDKEEMKKQMQPIAEELTANVFHPSKINFFIENYGYEMLETLFLHSLYYS